jgi:hypothetical protein
LGVTRRTVVDKERTQAAREGAATPAEKKRRTVYKTEFVVTNSPQYAFAVGDLFHAGSERRAVQVFAEGLEGLLEVHLIDLERGDRCGFHLPAAELAEWLRIGSVPTHRAIAPHDSYADWARYHLGKIDTASR